MSSGLVYGMELVGKEAVTKSKQIIGDPDPTKAEPSSIRALYGTDTVRNCIHVASSKEHALKVN